MSRIKYIMHVHRFWMMCFERFNKVIKDMCFNKNFPMASVANAYIRNAAAHYVVCQGGWWVHGGHV